MIASGSQRWRDGASSFRPPGETIDTNAHEVAAIDSDRVAGDFVRAHHYAGTMPAARYRFGLYRRGELAGVAVFSVPCNPAVFSCLACEREAAVELGRFVLLDGVEFNGETWFLARCFDALKREGVEGVVSFSDPMPRHTSSGALAFRGHVGQIYQAHNAVHVGRSRAQWVRMLPDGSILHRRALAKLTGGERGWRYVARSLEAHGATPAPGRPGRRLQAWARKAVEATTRRLRHPGNFKYAWGLDRAVRRSLPPSLPYPRVHTTHTELERP